MKIVYTHNRIEGWCQIPGWSGESNVITLGKLGGCWTIMNSMGLPSNIDASRAIHECFCAVFNKLDEIIADEANGRLEKSE